METIKVHCKKDFRGNIDIRDYIVNGAIDEGKSITVTCGSFPGKSVYTPFELLNPERITGPYRAQYGNIESYKLHSYPWKFND
jgi:hypothetical protein